LQCHSNLPQEVVKEDLISNHHISEYNNGAAEWNKQGANHVPTTMVWHPSNWLTHIVC
jgi:hypothetical protein